MSIQKDWTRERMLLWKLVNEEGTSKSNIAKAIGMSRSAVSRYVNDNYPDSTEITTAVREYLLKIGRWEETIDQTAATKEPEKQKDSYNGNYIKNAKELGSVITCDAERVLGICRVCHTNQEFGLITGNPGTGKTFMLELYKEQNAFETVMVTCDETSTVKSVLVETAEALELNPRGTSSALMRRIVKELKKHSKLLIYDEADLLKGPNVLEALRAIYDKSKSCGIVLCGNNALAEKMLLYAEDRPEMARLRDRIGYYQKLTGISEKEANEFLESANLTKEAKKLLISIGKRRGIRQLVKALGRLLDVTSGRRITEDLVQELGEIVLSFRA